METFVLDLPENYQIGSFELQNGHYITFEEYLEMDVEGAYLEWIDGKVIGFMPNNLQHQQIIGFLLTVIGLFVEIHNLGSVVQAGYAMKLDSQRRGREPDLVFVARENAKILKQKYLDGAADIAVEIVSPESVGRDRKIKFAEYETAGIREYWLIDPERRQAEFYRLNSDGFYKLAPAPEGVFHSEVLPEFFLRVEWLWRETLPTIAALKELKLI
jgi:Uma2 family endonuclease